MVTFDNPRMSAVFVDWPLGVTKRGECRFWLEYNPTKRLWRFVRQTTGKPKLKTYGRQGAIVDGSDGLTYLIQFAGQFDFINIWASDFMCADSKKLGFGHSVFPKDERYQELAALISQVNQTEVCPVPN